MNLSNIAEIEVTYKRGFKPSDRPKISKAEDAYQLLIAQWDENKLEFIEEAKMLLLNRANNVLGISTLSTGGVAGTVLDPKLVFAIALKANASAIILAHNHPSGNLYPSPQDRQITKQMKEAGKILDVQVLDHVILTNEGYYSFSEDMSYEKVEIDGKIHFAVALPF